MDDENVHLNFGFLTETDINLKGSICNVFIQEQTVT